MAEIKFGKLEGVAFSTTLLGEAGAGASKHVMNQFRKSDFPELSVWETKRLKREDRATALQAKRDLTGLTGKETSEENRLAKNTASQSMFACAEDPLFAVVSRRPHRRGSYKSKI
jgi:hypothetical protein